MTGTKFYIELPADEYGNTAMPPAVVEARYHPAGREGLTVISEDAHARHPRRLRPWPSEKSAAA
jgi:hypothetical protein